MGSAQPLLPEPCSAHAAPWPAHADRRPAGGGRPTCGGDPMNMRLTVAAATATVLASIALYPLLAGGAWFWAGLGAAIVVAAIGAVTRRRAIPALGCFAAGVRGGVLLPHPVVAPPP